MGAACPDCRGLAGVAVESGTSDSNGNAVRPEDYSGKVYGCKTEGIAGVAVPKSDPVDVENITYMDGPPEAPASKVTAGKPE